MERKNSDNETREFLLNISAQLFYERGYKNTKFHIIAEIADKPKSLINYYFPVKSNLVVEIMHDLIEEVGELVEDNVKGDAILRQLVFNRIFYQLINIDEKTGNFVSEVLFREDDVLKHGDVFELFYFPLLETEAIDQNRLLGRKLFIYGSVLEIIKGYYLGIIKLDWDEVVDEINRLTLEMIGIPFIRAQKYLEKEKMIASQLDYSKLRLLKTEKGMKK